MRLSLSPPRPPFPSRPPLIIISCAYFWCLRLKSCCELNIFIITSLSFTDQLTKYPRCQGNLACFVYVGNSRVNDNKSLFQITRFSLTYLTNYLTIRVKFLVYLSWNLHSDPLPSKMLCRGSTFLHIKCTELQTHNIWQKILFSSCQLRGLNWEEDYPSQNRKTNKLWNFPVIKQGR